MKEQQWPLVFMLQIHMMFQIQMMLMLIQMMMLVLAAPLGVPVEPAEAVGWDGNVLEAEAFGFLAMRSLRGLPLSLPTTTGVPEPLAGGRLHPAPKS